MNAGHVRILLGSTSKMGAGRMSRNGWWPRIIWMRRGVLPTWNSGTGASSAGKSVYERDPDNFSVALQLCHKADL
jgi:hypothetical protein